VTIRRAEKNNARCLTISLFLLLTHSRISQRDLIANASRDENYNCTKDDDDDNNNDNVS